MKQFNQWLLALGIMCFSLGVWAQDTPNACGSAYLIPTGGSRSVSIPASSDTVWHSFTPAANGYITISSCDKSNTTADTRLFLFQGTCGSLVPVATSDNDCGLAAALNNIAVVGGQTYFIRWDNKAATALSFIFTTSFVASGSYTQPANDNICNATAITVGGSSVAGNNQYATVQGSAEQNLSIPVVANATQSGWLIDRNIHSSVWYKFVAPTTNAVTIGISSAFDHQVAVFSGNCNNIASLTFLSAFDDVNSGESYCVTAGNTYYILVDGFGTETGAHTVSINGLDLIRPHIAIIDVTTNAVNGALCPGSSNWNLTGRLASQSNLATVSTFGYVNSLMYSWNGTPSSSVLPAVGAGAYNLTITDVCGATYTASVVLADTTIETFDLQLGTINGPLCVDSANGSVILSSVAGYKFADGSHNATDSIHYTYKYLPSITPTNTQIFGAPVVGVANINQFSNLYEGFYRVYAMDACGNVDSVSFALVDPVSTPVVLDLVSANNPICNSSSTGSITISATGGAAKPLTYTWELSTDGGNIWLPTSFNTATISDVPAGMYRVVASDPCGQPSDTLVVTLVDPSVSHLSYTASQTNPTTFAAKNGSIALTVSGGLPLHSSVWFVDGVITPEYNNALSLSNLPQGIYRVVVSDTCILSGIIDTTFVLLAPLSNDVACDAITITENDTLTTYHNFGANATEGLDIPYSQDGRFTGWGIDTNINRSVWFKFVAPASGAVSLKASHYQGLNSNLNFDAQVAVFSVGACATESGYSLIAANDNNFNGGPVNDAYVEALCLTPGTTYYVLVDGYQGIGEEGIFSLDLNALNISPLTVNTSASQPTCIDPLGEISFSNITGGVYSEQPELYTYTYTFSGGGSGKITVDGFGDIVTVDDTAATSITFDSLTSGSYTVTIFDTCGHSVVSTIEIAPIPFTPFDLQYTLEQPYCPGDVPGGSIEFTLTGGGTPDQYVYEIRKTTTSVLPFVTGNYNSLPVTEGLQGAGLYFIRVFDLCAPANTKEFAIELTDRSNTPFSAEAIVTDPVCPGGLGNVVVNLTGGRYIAYFELGGDNGIYENSYTFSNLPAGSYSIYVSDDCSGADTTISVNITDPTAAAISIASTKTNPASNGADNGSATYTITGGFAPYSVTVYETATLGGAPVSTVSTTAGVAEGAATTINGLGAGFYTISVTDACGIVEDTAISFELVNPPVNDAACSASPLTLGVAANGTTVAATVQSGEAAITPPLNVDCDSFEGWCFNNGIDASVWYTFTVPASGSFSVEASSVNFDPQIAVYSSDNCANFASYTRLAANDDKQVTPTNSNAYVEVSCLTPGTTVYVLVDASDFPQEGGFSIIANEINTVAFSVTSNVINSANEISNNGSIDLTVTGGVKPYTFVWSNGASTEDITNLAPGTYSVVVTDKCGAQFTDSFTIIFTGISNDNACDAKLLPTDNVVRQFNNFLSTLQPGEYSIAPDSNSTDCFSNTNWCKNDGIDGTVWFKFVAPSSTVTVDLCNGAQNDIDIQVAVYAVSDCSILDPATFTLLGANDDAPSCAFGSVLSLTGLTPCATYYVMVDSDEGEQGTFGIAIRDENSTLNAGIDTTVSVCVNGGTIDIANFRTAGTDNNGTYEDDDNSTALSGSLFDTDEVNAGTYHFTYTVTDGCGGFDYSTLTVVVENCTGINKVAAANTFSIYPNPNNGVFTIENTVADKITIEVLDMTGKVVYDNALEVVKGNKTIVNLSGASKGVYTIRINGNSNGSESHRIVVQ
ncbi:MAG: T9SS type A sorting domain-containing protein [Bacteroidota bacterium]